MFPFSFPRLSALAGATAILTAVGLPGAPMPEDAVPALYPYLEAAQEAAPHVQIGELIVREREGLRTVQDAETLPQLHAFARGVGMQEERDDLIGDEQRYEFFAQAQLRQAVYRWGALRAHRRLGDRFVEQAEIQLEETLSQTRQDVRTAYLNLLVARHREKVLRQQVEFLSQLSESEAAQVAEGTLARAQLSDTQLRLDENEIYLLNQRRVVNAELERLEELTGRNLAPEDFPDSGIPAFEAEPPQALLGTLPAPAEEPRVRALDEGAEIEREQEIIIRAQTRPRLDLIAGFLQDEVDLDNRLDSASRNRYFVGLEVNWMIFDGWRTRGQREGALARQRRMEMQSRLEALRIEREQERFLRDLDFAYENLLNLEERLVLVQEEVEGLEELVEAGDVSRNDLFRARLREGDTAQRLMAARRDYLLPVAQLLD